MNGPESKTNSNSILGGWVKDKNGFLATAKAPQDFTTLEFSKFGEAMRARWNLVEYFKVKFPKLFQRRRRG